MKKIYLTIPFVLALAACDSAPSVEELVKDQELLLKTIDECRKSGDKSSKKCQNAATALVKIL